jgi:adenylate cyclase
VLARGEREQYGTEQGWTYLAATQALLGQNEEAANAISSLLDRYPNSSLQYLRARETYFRRPQDLENLLAGLSEAGLPNWAFDFRGSESNRLNAQELRNIVKDKIWIGKHINGIEFFQQIDRSGATAYRSKNSIQTGTVSIRNGMLCQRFEGDTLSRNLCGYIYRNPDGSRQTEDEYIAALPATLRYFTVTQ